MKTDRTKALLRALEKDFKAGPAEIEALCKEYLAAIRHVARRQNLMIAFGPARYRNVKARLIRIHEILASITEDGRRWFAEQSRSCAFCGKKFDSVRKDAKYCSARHRQAASRASRNS